MAITLRSVKGSALTHGEMDTNFEDSSERLRIDVRNTSGATLTKGTVVKATGYNSGEDKVTVSATTASSDVAFGVLDADLANNTNGTVVNTGVVGDLDTSAFTVGDKLYSDGSGGFTATKPTTGEYQTCAFCLRSNATNGRLYVEFSEQKEGQATQAEMEAGTETGLRSMSPLRVAQAVSALAVSQGKNLIINGGMQVAQRGTSFTGVTASAYHLDRWQTAISSAGTWTITQDSDTPDGFGSSLKFDCTTADASLAVSDYLKFRQKIEGQNLQHLKYGTASAESVTIKFAVKSNKTGTYTVQLYNADSARHIASSFTVSSSGVWEEKTITFTGDTVGSFGNDNGASLFVTFWLAAGTNYTSGTQVTAWTAVSDPDTCDSNQVNLADSTANYINITGVQLELGDTATDFEHRSYSEELKLCERYYEIIAIGGMGGSAGYAYAWPGNAYMPVPFKTEKRAAPSLNKSGTFTIFSGGLAHSVTCNGLGSVGIRNCEVTFSASYTGFVRQNSSDALIALEAEL